ncbi:MAG: hypothetical protein IKH26_07050 [Bacteroidaceae bacterium]|nr:hypothetical protein [Bacteroidaceae bacterium]
MRCPNCNETEQELGARFCIVCGCPLVEDDVETTRKEHCIEEIFNPEDQQRVLPSWYHSGVGGYDDADSYPRALRGIKTVRWILLLLILAEYIFISIQEVPMHQPWGGVTIGLVNVPAFLMTLFLCADFYHDEKRGFWKTYYTWLHYLLAAAVPLVGYLIFSNIQNLWTIVLDVILCFVLLVADFGTLETIFSD